MQLHQKFPDILPRLDRCHPDNDEEFEYPRLTRFHFTLLYISSHKAARKQLLIRLQSRSYVFETPSEGDFVVMDT